MPTADMRRWETGRVWGGGGAVNLPVCFNGPVVGSVAARAAVSRSAASSAASSKTSSAAQIRLT